MSACWSFVPAMRFHVRGFRFRFQDDKVQLYMTADEGALTVRPLKSLMQRQFVGTHVSSSGIEMRIRQRLVAKDATEAKLSRLPPIPGLDSVQRTATPGPPPDEVIDKLIGVDLTDIVAQHVRDVWIDEYHFTGDVSVEGGFMFQPFRRFRLDRARSSASVRARSAWATSRLQPRSRGTSTCRRARCKWS